MNENHATDVQIRMNYLLARLCLADREPVLKSDLLKEVNKFLGHNVGEFAVLDSLRKIRDSGIPGFTLSISADAVTLKRRDTLILRERQRKHLELKRRIAMLLWEELLQIHIEKEQELKCTTYYTTTFKKKHQALRERSHVTFLVDAGSSTSFAIEQLLTTKSVPIQTKEGRLVRPTFITNSLEIADVVSRSDYPRDIPVRIIGGELRAEYGSICGPLTDICVSGWGGLAADVAIVGTTAYNDKKCGVSCFCCDDISEGRVKVQMLENAWLRVIILDSSKLAPQTSGLNPFAKFSSQLVDLVVIDDGKTTDQEASVTEMRSVATREGVSMVVMNSEDIKG